MYAVLWICEGPRTALAGSVRGPVLNHEASAGAMAPNQAPRPVRQRHVQSEGPGQQWADREAGDSHSVPFHLHAQEQHGQPLQRPVRSWAAALTGRQ